MGKKLYKHYTQEFKAQALALGDRIGLARAAAQLGVHVTTLHGWKKAINRETEKKIESESLEQENQRLRKENEELKKVNFILKRAAAFFSQDHLK